MPATQAPLFLQRLLRLGLQAQDDEELRLGKTLLNLGSLLFVPAALVWLGACKAIRRPGFPVQPWPCNVPAAGPRSTGAVRWPPLVCALPFQSSSACCWPSPSLTQLGIGALPGHLGPGPVGPAGARLRRC
jgi:hypothetical protein